MNIYLIADHFLQYALNMLIGFFLFTLLTEFGLWCFKIQNHRLRATIRLLPPLRMALEPLFWLLPSGASLINVGLFSCSHPLEYFLYRKLSEATKLKLGSYGLKTVIGGVLLEIPTPLIYLALFSAVSISMYLIVSLTVRYNYSMRHIRAIMQKGQTDLRPIFNLKLLASLREKRTQIVISTEIKVPLAAWGNCIMIPKALLDQLSQEEYEAVISHELEHHCWHDTHVRMVYRYLSALYWWVPMGSWALKIEKEQELASDTSVCQYDLSGLDLASALNKSVQKDPLNHFSCAAFARMGTVQPKHVLLERIKAALRPQANRKQNKVSAAAGVFILVCLALILGFVIC